MSKIDFAGRVSVWIDAHHAAEMEGHLMPSPIEVKTPGIRINFDSDPEPRTRFKDLFYVNLIPGSAQ